MGSKKRYSFRKTEKRKEIFESAIEKILPLIPQTSRSQALDTSVRLGRKYVDRMRDAKQEYQELEKQIEELKEQQNDLKDKWETEAVRFEDL